MASIDKEINSKFHDNKHRFTANLIYTANWFQNRFSEFLKPYGLSSQQYNILRILRGNGSWVTMNEIKSVMIERAPNATRLSDKLLNKKLVERKRSDEDRRVVFLSITEEGRSLLEKIDDDNSLDFESVLERISDEKAIEISEILDTLRG
jgi:DNA-binding MarR family transcriptional regulator